MQFRGYWVHSTDTGVKITSAMLDETELSSASNWQEAWQNEDPDVPHGYIDCLSMLHDVSRRITGPRTSSDLETHATPFDGDMPFKVNTVEDLSRFIQILIPKALPERAAE